MNRWLVALLALLASPLALSAVTLNGAWVTSETATPPTINLSSGGFSNDILILVEAHEENGAPATAHSTSCTFNGDAMTSAVAVINDESNEPGVKIWYLVNPDDVNAAPSCSGAVATASAWAIGLLVGAHQTTPISDFESSAADAVGTVGLSVTPTGVTDGYWIAGAARNQGAQTWTWNVGTRRLDSTISGFDASTADAATTAGDFTITATTGSGTSLEMALAGVVVSAAAAATPSFQAGPTLVTMTATTAQANFTTDQTGTVKAVTCPNGTLGTAAQAKVGNCTSDVPAVATCSEATTAGVADGCTMSGLTASSVYDLGYMVTNGNGDSGLAPIPDATTLTIPAITAGPTLGTMTATTAPTTFTTNINANVFGVACPDGQAAPTCPQIKLGDCTGDIDAVSAWSEATVGGVGDGHTFALLSPSTVYDLRHCANAPGGDSSVASIANATTTSGCVGDPVIALVGGDNVVTATEANVPYNGSNFCSSGTVTLEQSANIKTLSQDSYADTNGQADMSGAGMAVASGLLYGAVDFCVTNSASGKDCQPITVNPPSGTTSTTLAGGLASLTRDTQGNPKRLYGYPNDLQTDSRVAVRNIVGAGTVTIHADGSLESTDTVTEFDVDFSRNTGAGGSHLFVGTVGNIEVSGPAPGYAGGIADIFFKKNTPIFSVNLTDCNAGHACFVPGEAGISSCELKQLSSPSAVDQANGAGTNSSTLIVDDFTGIVPGDWLKIGSSYARAKQVDEAADTIGLHGVATWVDNDTVSKMTVGAGTIDGVSLSVCTLNGTPTVSASDALLVIRANDAAGLTADSP